MRDKRRARLRCTSLIMRAHIAEGVGRGPHMPAGSELAMNFCAYRVFMKGRGWLREHSADHFKERGGFHRMPKCSAFDPGEELPGFLAVGTGGGCREEGAEGLSRERGLAAVEMNSAQPLGHRPEVRA